MTFAPIAIAAVLAWQGVHSSIPQSPQAGTIPVRVTWGALSPDGDSEVTVTNDSPLVVTAWALGVSITRSDGSRGAYPTTQSDTLGVLVAIRSGAVKGMAAGVLQQALDAGLPAERMALALKYTAQRAIAQRANATAFRATIDQGMKYANVAITECRRRQGK